MEVVSGLLSGRGKEGVKYIVGQVWVQYSKLPAGGGGLKKKRKEGGSGCWMKTYVINHLMGRPTVVLQQIVILGSRRCDDFLHYRLFTERG